MFSGTSMHAVLAASDLERAKRWYSEKLGVDPIEEDEYGNLQYETGGVRFLIYQTEFAGTNKATAAGLIPDDFDGAVAQLKANGVEFLDVDFGEMGSTVDGVIASEDGQDKAAWFKDSEGNILAISTA